MPRKATAYSTPSVSMSRSRSRPVRNATSSTVGIGNRPCDACAAATIMASVAEGSSARAMAGPTSGIIVASDIAAMVMKNSAASAMGCRQNARTPSLTQAMPVRAGTMWSFMNTLERRRGPHRQQCPGANRGGGVERHRMSGGRIRPNLPHRLKPLAGSGVRGCSPVVGSARVYGQGQAPAQHALEVRGVVRLEHGGLARQVEVPQA